MPKLTIQQLETLGLSHQEAIHLLPKINVSLSTLPSEQAWQTLSKKILTPKHPFALHYFLFTTLFPHWPEQLDSAPAWIPDPESIKTTHLAQLMAEVKCNDIASFHTWSTEHYTDFWQKMLAVLNIRFTTKPQKICDLSVNPESPNWLVGSKLNIADSCFNAPPNKPAIVYQDQQGHIQTISYAKLNELSNQVANSLLHQGFKQHDAIAIAMPMHYHAVAIYLGIIKIGAKVVSIAESFSANEIATRLEISQAKAILTQDFIHRDNKTLPLYEKIIAANAPKAIVLSDSYPLNIELRANDIAWDKFLVTDNQFTATNCMPMDCCNILFSSGTTGNPKAIPWNHTTAIKAAADSYLHQDIQPNDIIAWPTSLGWMMGPWLIFAGLINQATLALYTDAPQTKTFGEFIAQAKVTILGVVPSLVAHWRQSHCMEGLNWNAIKLFSSTGECSNPSDMLYLMSLASYKPIIEYCGGTEIGGAYITSTLCEKNYPSVFTTPAMGSALILIDDAGQPTNMGEVALIPPAMGLSTTIINANHHDVYFANMPHSPDGKLLRRHGDQLYRLNNGAYAALGRVDDTMNIGGIKISSAEIERAIANSPDIMESAAVAITPATHGPSALVIFAVTPQSSALSKETIKQQMQTRINQKLNPLFKIYDVVFIAELPKTASNKILRKELRKQFQESIKI